MDQVKALTPELAQQVIKGGFVPCSYIHSYSCERCAIYKFLSVLKLAIKFYLPIHALPILIFNRKKVMETFDRKGRYYDFGPSPTIWSSKVWKSLDEVLLANNLDFVNLINNVPSEFSWYGEYLLSNKIIDVVAVGPLFKVFHYGGQREYYKQLGYTEESFSENYLGIVLQSNFTTEIKY
jgi:hypothetical protein